MTFIAPPYHKTVLILQLFIVVLFSSSLYFFLHSMGEKKNLATRLAHVKAKHQQAIQVNEDIRKYSKTVKSDSMLREMTSEPTWEKVEFAWESLELTELLARIHHLSNRKKIFVLESFEAGFAKPGTENAFSTDSQAEGEEREERFFHIQGYFLCP